MNNPIFDLYTDAKRALREAENLCWRSNVAILAPEHLLAGCLAVVRAAGADDLPALDALAQAVGATQGVGESELTDNVMWGSSARAALESTVARERAAGIKLLGARGLALGVIDSGEVSPMFYASLGASRDALRSALESIQGTPE
jgi:hypothetical protein